MGIKRIGRHLVEHHWRMRRVFPQAALDPDRTGDQGGRGDASRQVRFVVEGALDGKPLFSGQSARERRARYFLAVADLGHRAQ